MNESQQLSSVLREWAEILMRRSMHDLVRFTKKSGLSMGQLSALFRLYHGKSCGVSEVGDHLGVTNAAASQMVDRLVLGGYLTRAEDPNDRRSKQLALTEKAQALVREAIEARSRWLEELADSVAPQDQQAIIQALTVLAEATRKMEAVIP